MNYGKTFFGQHLIIKLRYKLTQNSKTAIAFAFPDLDIVSSMPELANPNTKFYKIMGCIRATEFLDFEKVMRIAKANAKIADAEFAIAEAKKEIKAETQTASIEDFDLNLMT